MGQCARPISAAFFCVSLAALSQQPKPAPPPPIVQPGAPGQPNKTLSPADLSKPPRTPAEADVAFMQGMIHHHAQAVEMVELLRTRGESKALLAFGERIAISQTDEIQYMKQWLEDRGAPTSMVHPMENMPDMKGMDMKGMDMKGMDMKGTAPLDSMSGMPPMPGMLTPEQMAALAKAKGPEFDRLFLTGMIQHHTGALTMVDDLYDTPGTVQDSVLYDFVTDITNTQSAEIKIMQGMLEGKK